MTPDPPPTALPDTPALRVFMLGATGTIGALVRRTTVAISQ